MTAANEKICEAGAPWSRGRFLFVAGVFFIAQVGLILATSERRSPAAVPAAAQTAFHAIPDSLDRASLSRRFFAADPVVFASATLEGFSGNAWLRAQSIKYNNAEELEPPAPVELDTRLFGERMRLTEQTNTAPFPLIEERGAQLEPLPVLETFHPARPQSTWRLDGPLPSRQISRPPSLASWPSALLLTNSVVEFAINRQGKVVAHRLISRSGSTEADAQALAATRQLRFEPLPLEAPELTWARAVFEWETTEPPSK
jgi:TonB family protein